MHALSQMISREFFTLTGTAVFFNLELAAAAAFTLTNLDDRKVHEAISGLWSGMLQHNCAVSPFVLAYR